MELPIQITFRGMAHSAALDAAVRERASKLEHFHPHVMSCRVVIELAARHKQQGKEFVARLDIKVAGAQIMINREHSEDPFVAVHDAFDAARRKLEDQGRRQRGDAKPHAPDQAGRG
jgi:ribosome-associated translation inhibitor RaiA